MHSSLCLRRTSSISSSLNSSLSELAPDTESMALGSAGSEMLSEMKDIKKNNYFSKVKRHGKRIQIKANHNRSVFLFNLNKVKPKVRQKLSE